MALHVDAANVFAQQATGEGDAALPAFSLLLCTGEGGAEELEVGAGEIFGEQGRAGVEELPHCPGG